MSSTCASSSSLDRLRVAEVEAQAVGRDERALLGDVIAEHLAQRLVQEMRRRMVGADGRAARVIDGEFERLRRASARRARPSTWWTKRSPSFFSVPVTRTRSALALHDRRYRRPGRRIRRRTASG